MVTSLVVSLNRLFKVLLYFLAIYFLVLGTSMLVFRFDLLSLSDTKTIFILAVFLLFSIALAQLVLFVSAAPFLYVCFLVFGGVKALIILYLGSLLSSVFAYMVGKHLLPYKPNMKRLLFQGKRTLFDGKKAFSFKSFIYFRLFGFGLFKYISFLGGYHGIKLVPYLLITMFCSSVSFIISGIALFLVDTATPSGFTVWLAIVNLLGLTFLAIYMKIFARQDLI